MLRLGIDIGSTTAKIAVLDDKLELVFSRYRRHNAKPAETLSELLAEIRDALGDVDVQVHLTGTAGMGLAERCQLAFVQEVVASATAIQQRYPEVRTLIDVGGEDAKIILFEENAAPTIRMNGACAGGTGAFIDQMAGLLGVDVTELNSLAADSTQTWPMASRCGVFARTDVQTLVARHVPRPDVVASVYRAVAFQVVSSLAHGADLRPKVAFTGGPLTFQPLLRNAFLSVLSLDASSVAEVSHTELIPALGAALQENGTRLHLSDVQKRLVASSGSLLSLTPSLPPLFADRSAFAHWSDRIASAKVRRRSLEDMARSGENGILLGIDCGSRTVKIVLTDAKGLFLYGHYAPNDGDPLVVVTRGLEICRQACQKAGFEPQVLRAAATGYGEDLMCGALSLDDGFVETMAHVRGAQEWDPEVSFILDIGGQDMKAMFVHNRVIQRIELNEACSSGTGSFIETFANTLDMEISDFALDACTALRPQNLGSRCTVFMNSKVKQALREGATPGDIAAGLAYSVVRNCFQKVLRIHDTKELGTHIVVQGGTFRNPAVLRALELHLKAEVIRPDIAELMGAYGAALLCHDTLEKQNFALAEQAIPGQLSQSDSSFVGFDQLASILKRETDTLNCHGCENQCSVQRMRFASGRIYYTGNKCERIFGNHGVQALSHAENLVETKRRLVFERNLRPDGVSRGRIGIPRVLNLWENFPFWATLFTEAGFEVVLSDPSSMTIAEPGFAYVMSENICFPAKIVHGHILDLAAKHVDRIFYPMVRHERQDHPDSLNSFNCPIVTGYPEVVGSAIDPARRLGVHFDKPPFSFATRAFAEKGCIDYLCSILSVKEATAKKAVKAAFTAQAHVINSLREAGAKALAKARKEKRLVVVLLGRPYHADGLINHRIPEILEGFGVTLLTEDSIPYAQENRSLDGLGVLTQWAYPNRFYDAAIWAAAQPDVEVIQLNSFGCGPDALCVDEVRSILEVHGKHPTILRIDEVSSPGAVRLRIRSLVESILRRPEGFSGTSQLRRLPPVFQNADRKRTILAPQFSPFYNEIMVAGFRQQGYTLKILPMSDHQTRETGLAYTNHDICYPATLVIGDLLHALIHGGYNPAKVALAITQTGGQCRASSYASMLKRALINAGFENVPVVTLTTGSTAKKLNEQPGFSVGGIRLGLSGFFGILYADALAKLFYATRPRAKDPEAVWQLVEKWLQAGVAYLEPTRILGLFDLLAQAMDEFASLLEHKQELPRIGIVGEIYVKFNPFANGYLCNHLMDSGIEPDVPPLVNFFLQKLVVEDFNQEQHLSKSNALLRSALDIGESVVNGYLARTNAILASFPVALTPFHTMAHLAHGAKEILSLVNQYGESWLIAGDIAGFIESGTNAVACLQPFGCIANHIIAKGVERRLKERFPGLSILFLDMDAGASEVNQENRVAFLVRQAKDDHAKTMLTRGKPEPVGTLKQAVNEKPSL